MFQRLIPQIVHTSGTEDRHASRPVITLSAPGIAPTTPQSRFLSPINGTQNATGMHSPKVALARTAYLTVLYG